MFTATDIYDRVKEPPFKPLRLRTSDGKSYDVYHPELVMIGRRELIVGAASSDDPRTFDRVSRVAIMHVTAIEDLPATRSTTSNGEP